MSCDLRKIQLIQYDMLKELYRICEKHGLRIFLAQGTLLGAVRYKGFIPWDDDLDVIMPYEDIIKLMEVFPNEAREGLFLTDYTVERHYPLMWRKIRAKGTLSRPVQYKDLPINWGICMDIFSVYPLPDNRIIRCFQVFFYRAARQLLFAEMTKYETGRNLFERLLEKLPIGIRHSAVRFAERCLLRNSADSRQVYVGNKQGFVMDRGTIFGPGRKLTFEDGEYAVPSEYKTYLEFAYGPDFMTPPPEEERSGHDLRMGSIEWSCDTTER